MKPTEDQIRLWETVWSEAKDKAAKSRNGLLADDANFAAYWELVFAQGLAIISAGSEQDLNDRLQKALTAWKQIYNGRLYKPEDKAHTLYQTYHERLMRAQLESGAPQRAYGTDAISFERGGPTDRPTTGRRG